MYRNRHLLTLLTLLFFSAGSSIAQQRSVELSGNIASDQENPISNANIVILIDSISSTGTTTDKSGNYRIRVSFSTSLSISVSYVGYSTNEKVLTNREITESSYLLDFRLTEETKVLSTIEIEGDQARNDPGYTRLTPKNIQVSPIPFGEFTGLLATLPGVVSNNELSSSYSVRGGNYDENLITVNDFPIYKPLIVRTGQQEGLGFINSDLAESADFYSGGWSARYGDKLSSSLNIRYKTPSTFKSTVMLSLLGGSLALEGSTKDQRFTYLLGVRHKRSEYLLNTLEVDGEYFPRFTDIQFLGTVLLSKPSSLKKTTLDLLTSYARNRYRIEPTTRETEFGTFNQVLRFLVAFEGEDNLNYDTYQSGLSLKRDLSSSVKGFINIGYISTYEREYGDLEGGYRLCDVDKDPNSSNFNNCAVIRGIGSNYFHARNRLTGELINSELGAEIKVGKSEIKTGFFHSYQQFEDIIQEYRFIDSLKYVTDIRSINTENDTYANNLGAYYDQTWRLANLNIGVGLRFIYRDVSNQLNVNPRFRLDYTLPGNSRWTLKFATGIYSQPPLYREMRDISGDINIEQKAQNSLHVLAGADYNFSIWGRPFLWSTEAYYKYLWDIIPYDLENVRIRYYSDRSGFAYATGLDMRIAGEFIPGTESWFSLGILKTMEDVEGDGQGYIRRPTDQRVNLGIFFEDHIPNNPTLRVNLRFLFGSGFPFSPPDNYDNRNSFQGDTYTRVDIGFSKIFIMKNPSFTKSIWVGLEILNLLGAQNTISYSWVQDVTNTYFAVPNNLSNRFFNLKVIGKFGKKSVQ